MPPEAPPSVVLVAMRAMTTEVETICPAEPPLKPYLRLKAKRAAASAGEPQRIACTGSTAALWRRSLGRLGAGIADRTSRTRA